MSMAVQSPAKACAHRIDISEGKNNNGDDGKTASGVRLAAYLSSLTIISDFMILHLRVP